MANFSDLLNFKSKKDRDDFFIAIAVVLFFAWLFWWLYPRFTGSENDPQVSSDIAATTIIEEAKDTETSEILERNDTDNDGVYDEDDKCPNVAGDSKDGCPLDSDGDGIIDSEDKCPKLKGSSETKGCPSDQDGDGVYDFEDKCPSLAGLKAMDGCPEPEIEQEEAKILADAVQGVEFKTGSAELRRTSRSMLYRITKIMKKYPEYNIEIIGHTDNTGDKDANMQLSIDRAKSCYDYLMSNDIDESRITYKGFGQKKPIESNETEEGRSKNRRVEFNLTY